MTSNMTGSRKFKPPVIESSYDSSAMIGFPFFFLMIKDALLAVRNYIAAKKIEYK